MLNKQKKPRPIRAITDGSSQTNDIYLIPYISEERYQDGHPSKRKIIEWTYDFGDINAEDIFILDSRWNPKTIATFATCIWNSPNYTGKPLFDNGWSKGKFKPQKSDFHTHKNSIELGYFHNQSFSTLSSQFYCADFSKINLNKFKKGAKSDSAYEMNAKSFMKLYKNILCDSPLNGCCIAEEDSKTIYAPKKFNRKSADKITNFNPSTDTLEIDAVSFGIENTPTFAVGKQSKAFKKLARKDFDFIYNQKYGSLYFNENGSEKGLGDGGIFAILKGAPNLTKRNLKFIEEIIYPPKRFKISSPDGSKLITIESDVVYKLNSTGTRLIEADQTSNANLWKWDIGDKGIIYSQIRRYYDSEAKDYITEYVRSYHRGNFKFNKKNGLLQSSQLLQEAVLTLYRPDFSGLAEWGDDYIANDPVIGSMHKAPKSLRNQFKTKGALLDITEWDENKYEFVTKKIHYRGDESPEHTPGATIKDFRKFGHHNVFYSGFEENFMTDNFFE